MMKSKSHCFPSVHFFSFMCSQLPLLAASSPDNTMHYAVVSISAPFSLWYLHVSAVIHTTVCHDQQVTNSSKCLLPANQTQDHVGCEPRSPTPGQRGSLGMLVSCLAMNHPGDWAPNSSVWHLAVRMNSDLKRADIHWHVSVGAVLQITPSPRSAQKPAGRQKQVFTWVEKSVRMQPGHDSAQYKHNGWLAPDRGGHVSFMRLRYFIVCRLYFNAQSEFPKC